MKKAFVFAPDLGLAGSAVLYIPLRAVWGFALLCKIFEIFAHKITACSSVLGMSLSLKISKKLKQT
jgi:GTP cyclohydrolase I